MIYIIFDLEWNMASGHYEEVGKPRIAKNCLAALKKSIPCFEIFQIGAVSVSDNFSIKDNYSALIKPQIYPQINKYVQRLTKVNWADLEQSPPFITVIYDFYAWIWRQFTEDEQRKACSLCQLPYAANAEERYSFSEVLSLLEKLPFMFGTWSTSDARPLRENLNYYALPNNLPAAFIDIQRLYELFSGDAQGSHSVKRAVDFLKINLEEDYHDALNDALYTAIIMKKLESPLRWASWDYFALPLPEKYSMRNVSRETFKTISPDTVHTQSNEQLASSLQWPCLNKVKSLAKKTSTQLFTTLGADLSDKNYHLKLAKKQREKVKLNCLARKYSLDKVEDKLQSRLPLLSRAKLQQFILTFSYDANLKNNSSMPENMNNC